VTTEQEAAFRMAGEEIRKLRLASGRSQESISYESGIDQSNLSKVERIGPHAVSLKKLSDLAVALDCIVEVSFRKREP
jgi:transcriptional regulator with XRE-family HTH domain